MAQLGTTFGARADILGNLANAVPTTAATSNLAHIEHRLPSADSLASEFWPGLSEQAVQALTEERLANFPEQKVVRDQIVQMRSGMVLLTGGPGSGKVRSTCLLIPPADHTYIDLFVYMFTYLLSPTPVDADLSDSDPGTSLPVTVGKESALVCNHGGSS